MSRAFCVRVARRAEIEIREAAVWWSENRTAAPEAFRDELQRAFELIRRHPQIGATSSNVALCGVRRVLLGRTRYYLYYRPMEDQETVEVLALWHTSRGGGPGL